MARQGNVSVANPARDAVDSRGFELLPLARLRLGVRLKFPIYDHRNVLLLSAGKAVTSLVVNRLKARGITSVLMHASELQRLDTGQGADVAKPAPAPRTAQPLKRPPILPANHRFPELKWKAPGLPDEVPFLREVEQLGAKPYDSSTIQDFANSYRRSIENTDEIFRDLMSAKITHADAPMQLARSALDEITQDRDLFVSLGITPGEDKYPIRHGVNSSMLAMCLGTSLGLGKKTLIELGIGCLLHDVGMLRIKPELLYTSRVFAPLDYMELTKHPGAAYEALCAMRQIPPSSCLVAYQMHERCDGSGYPGHRRSNQIHFLAKIAMVADSYVAMISPRPHRPALLAYHAMEQILRDTRDGKFDSFVVRTLLETVSLFPIGSYVELNDGRTGRVIRPNPEAYTKPIVELGSPAGGSSQLLDLHEHGDLQVTRPLPNPED